jgi:hypothetical protein
MRDFALAKGVILEREGVDEGAALTALLHQAVNNGTPPRCRVEEVVVSAGQPPPGPGWGLDE